MSMISEQIHYLRSLAADQTPEALYEAFEFDTLNEAADTIESFSAKLRAANYGGWISCSERFPEEDTDVLIYTLHEGIDIAYISDECWRYTREDEFMGKVENSKVIAWQPLPEPYHE